MTSPRVLAFLALLAGPLAAEDWAAAPVARALETPAHEALMRLRTRDAPLAPFETDGCSGGLSDVWQVVADRFPDFAATHNATPPWESCCVTHDRAYHKAGDAVDAAASFDARLTADRALQACVVETGEGRLDELAAAYDATPAQVRAAYDSIGQAMFLAVRFGGAPCSGLPWRWGFGYPGCTVLTGAFD